MSYRLQDRKVLNGGRELLINIGSYVKQSGLEPELVDLIDIRASQINGCAFCLAMHVRDYREKGGREDKIAVLEAWRETDWFTDRERAALAWTEALTILPNKEVPDEVFQQARAQFSEQELADLTMAVIAINGWNRINVAFHTPPVPFTTEAKEQVAAD
jgi:AhpD family alkylhydroperoxidase